MPEFTRIMRNPKILEGMACVRGKLVTVTEIVRQLGEGLSIEQVLAKHPEIEKEDDHEALRYAGRIASDHEIDLPS